MFCQGSAVSPRRTTSGWRGSWGISCAIIAKRSSSRQMRSPSMCRRRGNDSAH